MRTYSLACRVVDVFGAAFQGHFGPLTLDEAIDFIRSPGPPPRGTWSVVVLNPYPRP